MTTFCSNCGKPASEHKIHPQEIYCPDFKNSWTPVVVVDNTFALMGNGPVLGHEFNMTIERNFILVHNLDEPKICSRKFYINGDTLSIPFQMFISPHPNIRVLDSFRLGFESAKSGKFQRLVEEGPVSVITDQKGFGLKVKSGFIPMKVIGGIYGNV